MAATYETIIEECVQQALALPSNAITTEIRDLALATANEQGRIIWDSWPFDNEKLDEFDAPTADSDGIITFASNVDVVRAVMAEVTGQDTTTRIWAQDELMAAARGESVQSERWIPLADSSDGCRRIQVNADDDVTTYRILALKRYVDAVVDDSYDSTNPTATPTDYRVLEYVLDRTEPALRAYVKDALRGYAGFPQHNTGPKLLEQALKREIYDGGRERRVEPRYPMFDDVDSWRE